MPRSSRHSLLAPQRPEGLCSANRGHVLSDTPHRRGHLLPRLPESMRRLQCPDARHRLDPALRSASSSVSPLSKLVRSRTTRCFASSMRLGASGSGLGPRPRSPSPRCHSMEGRGKLDPLRLTAARTRRSRGSRSRASFAMGTANAEDPGRHRPMSATHDSVIKTGTLRPGTLHSVFPHLAVARASRRYSQPRRSRMHHEGVFVPRSVSARTEHASSPAGSPAERDSSRPPASPAALARRSVFEHRGSPPMV